MFEKAIDTVKASSLASARYGNFIGGRWVDPFEGGYFTDRSPINGHLIAEFAESTGADVELAIDCAHRAAPAWAQVSPQERARALLQIADRLEQHADVFALAETIDNGKPIRESRGADLPLAIDHFRYFAGCVRADEGSISTIDSATIAYHFKEPLGVVGQIIPWNFPLLMAAWKLAPALAAGNCVVIKAAEQTPLTLAMFADLTADILPAGVLNVISGVGHIAGRALAESPRIAKVAFTGSTEIGRTIMGYAARNLIPQTMELGGKSPNIFMADVMREDDAFLDKALEGFALFAFNKGEVCTCPSRVLIQDSIFDAFLEKALTRVDRIRVGDPLDEATQMGPQASQDQLTKILDYIDIGRREGADCRIGGERLRLGGELDAGFFVQPTVFVGDNSMRIFQEEIFGPVVAVTRFKNKDEAIRIANDTRFGLGAGVWTRDVNDAYHLGRGIAAGRVWTNCYHAYPAHAAFGGYKDSGFGRENHRMMLAQYQQIKNVFVSYDENKVGLF